VIVWPFRMGEGVGVDVPGVGQEPAGAKTGLGEGQAADQEDLSGQHERRGQTPNERPRPRHEGAVPRARQDNRPVW